MKVGLNVPKNIGGKIFPAGCVVDLFEPDAIALIASGEGAAVPDGTMARKKAYGVPGCIPPAGFDAKTASVFAQIAGMIAENESRDSEGTKKNKQTNTKK